MSLYTRIYNLFTCMKRRSQPELEPVYSITRRSHGCISADKILPWGLWLRQANILSIPFELLLCVRSVGGDYALLPTIKEEINMNINHHNKYYE
jgi:hypothetical protein